MKLGPVAKLDKRNTTTSKQFNDDVISKNCDTIPIYGRFAAIRKPDFGRMVYKIYNFINNNLLSYKT